jgi:hypothetical protein
VYAPPGNAMKKMILSWRGEKPDGGEGDIGQQ